MLPYYYEITGLILSVAVLKLILLLFREEAGLLSLLETRLLDTFFVKIIIFSSIFYKKKKLIIKICLVIKNEDFSIYQAIFLEGNITI